MDKKLENILIIDYGSQYTQLIARRIREFGVLSEIITLGELKYIKNFNRIKGIILSGGPATVTNRNFPNIPKSGKPELSCLLMEINLLPGHETDTTPLANAAQGSRLSEDGSLPQPVPSRSLLATSGHMTPSCRE